MLRLAALGLGGAPFVARLPCALGRLAGESGPLRVEVAVALHDPQDGRRCAPGPRGCGIEITRRGQVRQIIGSERRLLLPETPIRKPPLGSTGNAAFFFLGYGLGLRPHDGSDRFDFSDAFFRTSRFASLFSEEARLTDPAAYLTRLHYRACRVSRVPAIHTLESLAALLNRHLGVRTDRWRERTCDIAGEWARLTAWQRRALVPVLDAVRHVLDASPFFAEPLRRPGVMLLDRPERLVPREIFPRWISLVGDLLPEFQFVTALSPAGMARFSTVARRGRIVIPGGSGEPEPPAAQRARRRPRLPPGCIVLHDVDSRLPNLALMKLSRHFKDQGRRVVLARKGEMPAGPEAVYASAVFARPGSAALLDRLRKAYGDALVVGGSGVDARTRLPPEVEQLPADYSLYPELGDRALGFLTRGCPFHCRFCIVPAKEGAPRRVSDLDSLLDGRRKLILLDDNILSHPDAAALLDQMGRREVRVNLTQTLDIRLVDRALAQMLRRVSFWNTRFTRRTWYFSLNHARGLDRVRHRYDLFQFTRAENVEFVCMYGYDTTLEEDLTRFRFLRSLPGAYVFVQEYLPIPGRPAPELPHFFGKNPDRTIRELVAICYTQNMKSMERYYRWLSRRYAMAFGRLNHDLVDVIFRYNNRSRRGLYVATLAGLQPRGAVLAARA